MNNPISYVSVVAVCYNALHCSAGVCTVQCNTVQCRGVHCAVQRSAVYGCALLSAVQCSAGVCTVQCNAGQCSVVQSRALKCSTVQRSKFCVAHFGSVHCLLLLY